MPKYPSVLLTLLFILTPAYENLQMQLRSLPLPMPLPLPPPLLLTSLLEKSFYDVALVSLNSPIKTLTSYSTTLSASNTQTQSSLVAPSLRLAE